MRYIKIPVTEEMEEDLERCDEMSDCLGCSLNACLGDHKWYIEEDEDGKEKANARTGAAAIS